MVVDDGEEGSSPSDTLQSLDVSLSLVEQGLEGRPRLGRAGFNSIGDQLGSIRNRLVRAASSPSVVNSDTRITCSITWTRLSQRLETAELAHSQRLPIQVFRSSTVVRQRSITRDSILNIRRHNKSEADVLQQSSSRETASDSTVASEMSSRTTRSASILVASRARAEREEGFDKDMQELNILDIMQNDGSSVGVEVQLLPSVRELLHEESSDALSDTASETPVLVTKRQSERLLAGSSSSISGSIRQIPSKPGSVVYSWGSGGVQSLHDDDKPRCVADALVGPSDRLGRPSASAILSVATSSTVTVCSTVQGEVLACGRNEQGVVDPNNRDDQMIKKPRLLESLGQTTIMQVSAGLDHIAALASHGSVLTWGSNEHFQLGHRLPPGNNSTAQGATYCRPAGMALPARVRGAAVACGHHFTLVLTTRMSLLAAGVGEIAGFDSAGGEPRTAQPVPALEGLPLLSIAAGYHHAVVVTAQGTAFSWGKNTAGCCGRPFPKIISMPVPVHVPPTSYSPTSSSSPTPFPNWSIWSDDHSALSLASDVAVVHAACGAEHTVLVTRAGGLLVCGSNRHGQLGLDSPTEEESSAVAVAHPTTGRSFATAEAGVDQTLLLDDAGDVWHMGHGSQGGPKAVLTGKNIVTIAAGGNDSIAIAAGSGAIRRQFSVSPEQALSVDKSTLADTLEELLATVAEETDDQDQLIPSGEELARRTEELLKYPAVLNGLFFDLSELVHMLRKLVSVGNTKVQQAIANAIEKGVHKGILSLHNSDARMIYPEAVRCLLLYISFLSRDDEGTSVSFDSKGTSIAALCESILGLPFEGYKAMLAWATTMYSREYFVKLLVRPLLNVLNKGLKLDIDADGVEHAHVYRGVVPLVVSVLRWLHKASEKAGNIAKPEDFYSDGIEKYPLDQLFDDLYRMKSIDQQQRAFNFFLCANPFLFPPSTKRNLLHIESQVTMIKTATQEGMEHRTQINPFWKLEIERDHLLEQTLAEIKKTEPSELRKKLTVVFKGEEGVDAGGVTKEFFQLLSEELFGVYNGMWTDRFGDQITWFNSDYTCDDEGYELTGVLVGLALYNSVLLDVRFPMAVYRKLLGLPLGLEDMVDESLQKGLQQLLDYDGDDVEEMFGLNFEVGWMNLGEEQRVQLKPGGSNIPVTNDNREEYVLLYVRWLLVDSVQPQWDSFEKGIMRVMEGSSLNLCGPEELELLVVGTPELDFSALEANTTYEGGFESSSPIVRNFWRFIKNADRESQIKFLKFATGSSMSPIGGLGEIGFKIQRAGPDSPQLPTSHTCFNTLLLPDYGDNYDKLEERLGRAILECEGFGLQ